MKFRITSLIAISALTLAMSTAFADKENSANGLENGQKADKETPPGHALDKGEGHEVHDTVGQGVGNGHKKFDVSAS